MLLETPKILTGVTFIGIISLVGVFTRLVRTRYVFIKRLIDIILSFIAIIINIPAFAILGIIIKLTSRGTIFYTQTRVGKDGKPFTIIKLRTMRVDAEDGIGPVWAEPSEDPRVTKVGYYMRRLHMDEIPQFINILKGDMSFVGPRPERPFFVDTFKRELQNYTHRLLVKPGLTGLAQARYKYDESIDDVKRKLSYDLLYIRKMCLSLDCKILFWTLGKITLKLLELFYTKERALGSDKRFLGILRKLFPQRARSS